MKSLILIPLLFTLSGCTVLAKSATKEPHREHSAHVHGAATLAMAFEGPNGKVEFKTAAESVLGFEHVAKSAKDRSTFEQTKGRFESIGQYIQMDPALLCHFSVLRIEQKKESEKENHSDFIAEYNLDCAKDPLNTKIKIDFSSFPNLNDLDITILAGNIQKNLEAKKTAVVVELK